MNTVEPIRDLKRIGAVKKYLLGAGKLRDYALFVVGINMGLRISDLLNLKWQNGLTEKKKFKDGIYIREGKTGKEKRFPINESTQNILKRLFDSLSPKNLATRFFFRDRANRSRFPGILPIGLYVEPVGL